MSNGDLTQQNKSLRTRAHNQRKEIKILTKRLELVEDLNAVSYIRGYVDALHMTKDG